MNLVLHNTQSKTKEVFTPIDPEHVKMYVCGPTVYNLVHIGNARPAVVFDTLFRLLQSLYPRVSYARNITDIDDKIMKAARENNEPIGDLAARYTTAYREDMAALNCLPPSITPFATEHVGDMLAMIEKLIANGHAYEAQGHVLFDVNSMANYGCLSHRSLEDMLQGARVEVAPYKKYGGDFVLWKPSAPDEPGWASPWGRGRPGWHLECSAMIARHLGQTIDIHGGGRDLIFPHHENEVAQSECAHGRPMVNYWLHNGYLNIDGEKMSKSLGNFRTVRELLGQFRGEVIRFALLSAQYRSEMDFSGELLRQAKTTLDSVYAALRQTAAVAPDEVRLANSNAYQALLDDLNTPLAFSHLHQVVSRINKQEGNIGQLKGELLAVGKLMGVFQQNPDVWFQQGADATGVDPRWVERLIAERQQAKVEKQYARADALRAELAAAGVILEDSREGTKWRVESR